MCGESNAIAWGNWRNVGMTGYQIGRKKQTDTERGSNEGKSYQLNWFLWK